VIAEQPWLAMAIGSVIALFWAGTGAFLGARQKAKEVTSGEEARAATAGSDG